MYPSPTGYPSIVNKSPCTFWGRLDTVSSTSGKNSSFENIQKRKRANLYPRIILYLKYELLLTYHRLDISNHPSLQNPVSSIHFTLPHLYDLWLHKVPNINLCLATILLLHLIHSCDKRQYHGWLWGGGDIINYGIN